MSHMPTHDNDSKPEFDSLSSEAGAWLASLSAPVRVHGLAEHAPDIANQLAASWSDVPSTALLLEQLLLDEDVQSLPPTIAGELLRLYEYHVRCRATDAPNTTWELPASGLQDLQPITASRRSHP
jgi:hypothetical protein